MNNFTEQKPLPGQAAITVFLEPDNKRLDVPRPRTVLQMLNKLGLRPTACLVIRHPALDAPAATEEQGTVEVEGCGCSGAAAECADIAEERRKLRGSLLTHDLQLFNGDVITVRKVASHG